MNHYSLPPVLMRQALQALDALDPLAPMRERFQLPEGVIYLDGNSLGALPKTAVARLTAAVQKEWGEDLISSWTGNAWIELPQRIGDAIARLIGAGRGEVVVADSTSVNIFKLLAGALKTPAIASDPKRRFIVVEAGMFPTDVYMAEGLNHLLQDRFEIRFVEPATLGEALNADVAVALLTHVDYRSGRVHDMKALNARAHAAGTVIIWDLSHSAGAIPLALREDGSQLAVGCGYKYLNGGPGAPAFVFVAEPLQSGFFNPLSGWMGHRAPFAFDDRFSPALGISRMLSGTPPVLGCIALEEGVACFDGVNMNALREKSLALSDSFWQLMDQECGQWGFQCIAPREHALRGSQLSFAHDSAWPIMQALIERRLIGDFRQPNLIRFGFTPLYIRFVDIWDAVAIIRDVMQSGAWQQERFRQQKAVT